MSAELPPVRNYGSSRRHSVVYDQQEPVSPSTPQKRRVFFEVHAGAGSSVFAALLVTGILACILLVVFGLLMLSAIVIAVMAIVATVRAWFTRGSRRHGKRWDLSGLR